jgi:RHS repeat-associated protein
MVSPDIPDIVSPVCMIEEAESETYYYHYDGLGSVVALSDSSGDTVQTYQYSVFGQVAASDDDFPNPYMFAGRRYDIEIGQYYNRARYYNPYTGRFLQTDPIGYGAGMNLYAYCGSNPLNYVDPSGLTSWGLTVSRWWEDGSLIFDWVDLEAYYAAYDPEMENWYEHARLNWDYVVECSEEEQGDVEAAFLNLDTTDCGRSLIDDTLFDWSHCTQGRGIVIQVSPGLVRESDPNVALGGRYDPESNTIYWNPVGDYYQPAWIALGHEMIHADHLLDIPHRYSSPPTAWEIINEEALTQGVNIVDENGNRIRTCSGDPYAPHSVMALYYQAGYRGDDIPLRDLTWSPEPWAGPAYPR